MPTASLCLELLKQYQCQTKSQLSNSQQAAPLESSGEQLPQSDFNCRPGNRTRQQQQQQQQQTGEHTELDDEYLIAKKRRVVKFVRCWMLITREHFFHQQQIQSFLTVSLAAPPAREGADPAKHYCLFRQPESLERAAAACLLAVGGGRNKGPSAAASKCK